MDLNNIPVLDPQVATRIVDGSAVIVAADSGQVTVLNKVGTRVWELIDGVRSVGEIISFIQSEYNVDPERARQDVYALLQKLIDSKILELN